MNMKVKHGIVLYVIEGDCLTGTYNNELTGEPHTEVATKRPGSRPGLAGSYDCFYIDLKNERNQAVLEITEPRVPGVYHCKWTDLHGNPLFVGTAFKFSGQLVVNYKSA
jgi:hypothetical protein